jgi:tetratricopeptide (TPR) repeat protein
MTYAGNTALSSEIQNRILTTFKQTLNLAGQGSRQEALLGCDFILRLDPLFEPARTLYNRLQAAEGPVATDDLQGVLDSLPGQPAPPAVAPPAAGTDTTADIGGPPSLQPQPDTQATADDLFQPDQDGVGTGLATDQLRAQLMDLLEQREFQEIKKLAKEHRTEVAKEADLQAIVATVTQRLEAQPYLRSFIDSAIKAHHGGNVAEARKLLEKGKNLDPTHPEILQLEEQIAAAETVATAEQEVAVAPKRPAAPVAPAAAAPPATAEPAPSPPPAPPPVAAAPAPPQPPTPEPPAAAAPATEEAPSVDLPEDAAILDQPSASLDAESEARVSELLEEGQAAFDRSEYQTAIDAWSRIFLIEIDHPEANRRIELARKLKEELERKVEEAFHEGLSHLEDGTLDKATQSFKNVLKMQPNHLAAREYLQKIESGEVTVTAPTAKTKKPATTPEGEPLPPEEDFLDTGGLTSPDAFIPPPEKTHEIDMEEGEIGEELATRKPVTQPKKPEKSRGRTFALIGVSVLLLVAVGGYVLFSKRDQIFPNSGADQAGGSDVAMDPISRAKKLHEEGRTPIAIAQLRRLPPGDPQYAEAQALIAQWESPGTDGSSASDGPAEEDLARRELIMDQAHRSAGVGDNLLAWELLERAAEIHPLNEEEIAFQTTIRQNLEVLQAEWDLFRQSDWEYAIPSLWRIYEQHPDNRDVRRLIVDSYFNLGVRDLQRADPSQAAEKFKEALKLRPDDIELQRLTAFAETYKQRPTDLLYRIFVKYHPFR